MTCLDRSDNAAGNKGFDEVAVTLEKREIPGTGPSDAAVSGPAAVLNLYLPQAPTAEQADTLQYYRGERDPAPDDPSLTETQADSLAFAGVINGLPTEITLISFAGLTAQADTLTAHISYTIAGVQTSQDLTLTETGPETRLFRLRFTDPTPETLKANIYLPVSPTPEAPDVLQYYYGPRLPLPDDPVLSEAPDAPASLVFRSALQGEQTTVTIDPATFSGVTADADALQAAITHIFGDGSLMTVTVTFTETAAESMVFRATLTPVGSMPGVLPAFWTRSVARIGGHTSGVYGPFTARVRGLASLGGYRVPFANHDFELTNYADGWSYIHHNPLTAIVLTRNPKDASVWRAVYYNELIRSMADNDNEIPIGIRQLEGALTDLRNKIANRNVQVLWAEMDFGTFMTDNRRDDHGTPAESRDDRYWIYPSHHDCFEWNAIANGYDERQLLRYRLAPDLLRTFVQRGRTFPTADTARVRVYRLVGTPERYTRGPIQFEADITDLVRGEGFQGDRWYGVFSGITSSYREGTVQKMTYDASGEANGINDQGQEDLRERWKFLDPGPTGNAGYEVELLVRCARPVALGEAVAYIDVRDVRVFGARRRYVCVREQGRRDGEVWWLEAKRLTRVLMGQQTAATPEASGPHVKLFLDGDPATTLRDAFRCLTPRGSMVFQYHGSFESSPVGTPRAIHPAGPQDPDPCDDGTDLYGILVTWEGGRPTYHAGFAGNGIAAGTQLPANPSGAPAALEYQPYDLGGIPRAHGVDVSLVICWGAHRTGWDDAGPSVLDTLWNVWNRNCCSARVGSSWGKSGSHGQLPAKFGRPRGDDEGSGADDFDPDQHPSCYFDDPKRAENLDAIWRTHYANFYGNRRDPLYDNWVERPPRDPVKAGE